MKLENIFFPVVFVLFFYGEYLLSYLKRLLSTIFAFQIMAKNKQQNHNLRVPLEIKKKYNKYIPT